MPDIKKERAQKANKQVVIVGTALILVAVAFLLWTFISDKPPDHMVTLPKVRQVPQVDFEFLESSEFKNFERYQRIGEINFIDDRELGRDNPFISY
jgi:hypothetical protein